MAKTPLVVVACRVFGLYHPSYVGGDLNVRGTWGVDEGDWEKSLRSLLVRRGIGGLSGIRGRIWGSWVVRQQLCPPFSRLHSLQETCFLSPHSSLCVLSSVAEFAEKEGGRADSCKAYCCGKVDGRRQEAWKLLPVLHTPIRHPAVIKPKICPKQDWRSDLHLLGDSESQYSIIGKTGNQPREQ